MLETNSEIPSSRRGKPHQTKLLLLMQGCVKQNVILSKLFSQVLQRRKGQEFMKRASGRVVEHTG